MGDTTLHIQLADESEMIAYLRWARQKAIELGCKLDEIWFIMAEQYAREHEERESQIRADKRNWRN